MYFLISWFETLGAQPDYGLFGGSIELLFETEAPSWMVASPHALAPVLGARHLPEGPAAWDDIFGGNMATRRAVLDQGFRFDESIGPGTEQGIARGEDSEFCQRVAASGIGCWFAKGPIVRHIVRPDQLTEDALIERAYQIGRGRAYLMLRRGPFRQPPKLSWTGRLKLYSPVAEQRYESLFALHLSRGFQEECARSTAEQ
jgi:hypothetical protein